jgi:hypothetical protein
MNNGILAHTDANHPERGQIDSPAPAIFGHLSYVFFLPLALRDCR